MTLRRSTAILAALLLLGLVLRVWIAAHLVMISADGITRIGMARAFQERGFRDGLTACLDRGYHPFNPFLIGMVKPLVGDFERAGFAVSIAFGTLGIAAIFLLAREAWGERVGLLAALLWALLPNAVHTSADVLTEGQFLALWMLSAWAGLSALKRGLLWRMGVAGLLAGLAYLTRAEGLGVLVALGILLLMRRRIKLGLALGAGFLLAASPYLLHLHAERGRWSLTPQKSVTNLITRKETVWEQRSPSREIGFLERAAKYGDLVQTGVKTLTPWLLAFALAGLWRKKPWGIAGGFLLLLALVHSLVLIRLYQTAGYASHRHFMTLAVIGTAWAAAGLSGLSRRAAFILGGALCAALLVQACQVLRDEKAYRKELGLWLGVHVPEGTWIASRAKPEIAYYARRTNLSCEIDGEIGFGRYLKDLETWLRLCSPKDPRNRPLILKEGGRKGVGEILILERPEEEAFIREASFHPSWEAWPLPEPHAGHFAAFTRKKSP